MPNDFMPPYFDKYDIELRYVNDVVSIYGTAKGLKLLADICLDLVEHPAQGHVHLDKSHGLPLTQESKNGAVAIFEREPADTRRG